MYIELFLNLFHIKTILEISLIYIRLSILPLSFAEAVLSEYVILVQ